MDGNQQQQPAGPMPQTDAAQSSPDPRHSDSAPNVAPVQLPADSPADSRFNWKWSNLLKPFRSRSKTIAAIPQTTTAAAETASAASSATATTANTPMKRYKPRYTERDARMSVVTPSREDVVQLAREKAHEMKQIQSAENYEERMRRYVLHETGFSNGRAMGFSSYGGPWIMDPARSGVGLQSAKVACAQNRLRYGVDNGPPVVAESSADALRKREMARLLLAGVDPYDFAGQGGEVSEEEAKDKSREAALAALSGEASSSSTQTPGPEATAAKEQPATAVGSSDEDLSLARTASSVTPRPTPRPSTVASTSSQRAPNQFTYRPAADPMRNRPVSQSISQVFPQEFSRHRIAYQPVYGQLLPNNVSQPAYQASSQGSGRAVTVQQHAPEAVVDVASQPSSQVTYQTGAGQGAPGPTPERCTEAVPPGQAIARSEAELAGSTNGPPTPNAQSPGFQPYYFGHGAATPNLRQSSKGKERAIDRFYAQGYQRPPGPIPATGPNSPSEPVSPGTVGPTPVSEDLTSSLRDAASIGPSSALEATASEVVVDKHKDSVQQDESYGPDLPLNMPPAPESNASTDLSSKSKPSTKTSGTSAEVPSVFSSIDKSGAWTPSTDVSTGKRQPFVDQQMVASWIGVKEEPAAGEVSKAGEADEEEADSYDGDADDLSDLGADYHAYLKSL